jgi:hypothetical protein
MSLKSPETLKFLFVDKKVSNPEKHQTKETRTGKKNFTI